MYTKGSFRRAPSSGTVRWALTLALAALGVKYASPGDDAKGTTPAARRGRERRTLYDAIERATWAHGLQIGRAKSQGVSAADLFRVEGTRVVPKLQRLDAPVRALVAPLTGERQAQVLRRAFETHVLPITRPQGVWQQDPQLFHATVWHASPHQHPVPADERQQAEEVASVRRLCSQVCPSRLVLERIVVSPGGVVMACWQRLRGIEPEELRKALQAALPNAPEPSKQTVQSHVVWYVTLGRLTEPPAASLMGRAFGGGLRAIEAAAQAMTDELCGLEVEVNRLWYVREFDKMALALNGTWSKEEARFTGCDDKR